MKIPRRARDEVSVELTPLIDVVFLLLIFFMVSSTFIRESQVKIDLPEASGELLEAERDAIEITVDRRGEYSVNGRILVNGELGTLVRALQEVKQGLKLATGTSAETSKRVIVTADANSSHQSVIRAMDAAGKVGLTRISITTQQSDDEG